MSAAKGLQAFERTGLSFDGSILHFRPLTEEIVIHPGELDGRLLRNILFGEFVGDSLDAEIEVEEEGSLSVVPDHALEPEKGAKSGPASYRRDMVETG